MESEGKKRLIRISVWIAVLSLLLAVVSSLATALAASAHAALLSMSPAAGSTVTKAPAQVVLTFNEAVSTSFATVTVTGQDGDPVSSGRPDVSGKTVTQKLADTGSGRYTVAFRVVSEDGHPVSGKATFTVRIPAPETTTARSTATSAVTQSASASTTASAPAGPDQAAQDTSDSGSPALLFGLGAAAVALVGAGAIALGRRGSGGQ
jgi:copper resistance protein C